MWWADGLLQLLWIGSKLVACLNPDTRRVITGGEKYISHTYFVLGQIRWYPRVKNHAYTRPYPSRY
jgi:hypothetical protein